MSSRIILEGEEIPNSTKTGKMCRGVNRIGRSDSRRGNFARPTGYGENFNSSVRGGAMNTRFGKILSGYKRVNDDRE
jgi:hypothetical protein